jgi:hypothetical protein
VEHGGYDTVRLGPAEYKTLEITRTKHQHPSQGQTRHTDTLWLSELARKEKTKKTVNIDKDK